MYESIAVAGPTASGKTSRAVALAKALGGEIISADSRQVYRGMDIGTGKDLGEYEDISYHLIDIAEAGSKYNLHRFISDFNSTYRDIISRDKFPVICGGSGMYLENALAGIILPEVPENPELRISLADKTLEELTEILSATKHLHNSTDVDTSKRAIRAIEIERYYAEHPEEAAQADRTTAKPLNTLLIALDISREDRRRRITERLDKRLEAGMLDEVKRLLDSGISPEDLIYYGLEYKYLTLHLIGDITFDEMHLQLETAIHQFAKRQMTWLRGMERRGFNIHWIPYDLPLPDFIDTVKTLLALGHP